MASAFLRIYRKMIDVRFAFLLLFYDFRFGKNIFSFSVKIQNEFA